MQLAELFPDVLAGGVLAIAAVFLLAGIVKGAVGLGLPTVSMALLALIMAPVQAAALLIVPSLATNLWQTRPWSTLLALLKRLGGMQVGAFLGTLAGAWFLGAPAGAWAMVSLGLALLTYAAWGLFGSLPTIGPRTQTWLGPVVGAITGIITAATGVFVVPAVPYLQSLGLARDDLVQAMGISFSVSTVSLALGLWLNGEYSVAAAGGSLAMLVPAIAGMYLGQLLRKALSPQAFRKCFLGSLLLLGIHLILKEWLV